MNADEMRKRFHELGAKREEILARTTPLREKRDALVQEYAPRVRELEKEIRKVETEGGLFDLDQERAALARALKGKTGEPPAAEGAGAEGEE